MSSENLGFDDTGDTLTDIQIIREVSIDRIKILKTLIFRKLFIFKVVEKKSIDFQKYP